MLWLPEAGVGELVLAAVLVHTSSMQMFVICRFLNQSVWISGFLKLAWV